MESTQDNVERLAAVHSSPEIIVAALRLPVAIDALAAITKGLSASCGDDLCMRQIGEPLEIFRPANMEPACERCKGTGEIRPDGYSWCCPDCGGTGKANGSDQ
jgi:rubredoxin